MDDLRSKKSILDDVRQNYWTYLVENDRNSFDKLEDSVNKLKELVDADAKKFYPHRHKISRWSDAQDRWLDRNAEKYNRRPKEMTEALNKKFGTRHTVQSVQERKCKLSIRANFYTKEQEEWLKKHFYLGREKLTNEFNKTFGTYKSVVAIGTKMLRMKAYMN